MRVVGDVKCYHCGHVSGQIEGTQENRLVLRSFKPRPGFTGTPPKAGERIRCERCGGPVFLEDLLPLMGPPEPIPIRPPRKRKGSADSQAA